MAQKLRKHGKNWKKTSVGCDIDFTILLSMLKVKILIFLMNALKIEEQWEQIKSVYTEKFLFLGIQCSFRAENSVK